MDGAVVFPNTYPLDGDFSGELLYLMFEQLGPGLSFQIFFFWVIHLCQEPFYYSIADGYPYKEQAKTS